MVPFDFMLTLTNEMMDATYQKFKHCACLNTKLFYFLTRPHPLMRDSHTCSFFYK